MMNDYDKEILEIKLSCINKLFTVPPQATATQCNNTVSFSQWKK